MTAALTEAVRRYSRHHGELTRVLAMSVAVQAIRVVQAWCLGEALGLQLPLLTYFAVIPVILLIMQVPVTINGLGTTQVAFVSLLVSRRRRRSAGDRAFAPVPCARRHWQPARRRSSTRLPIGPNAGEPSRRDGALARADRLLPRAPGVAHGLSAAPGAWIYLVLYVLALAPGLPLGFALFGRHHAGGWIAGAVIGLCPHRVGDVGADRSARCRR